ncbi:pantoate--beta-alanine ligase [Sphingomonas alba]|uniref:Pantothenate synthetase n=1 Tax=Sphingomonas alba TaxID=2908208 RepID=A0ABT0RQ16_9SPHN|nr:pantoate--beta-alanine ligase [Sphingomonas alba]MCL6684758.1 pantoate--beta-alanine ligase [Sphingomonas alba]
MQIIRDPQSLRAAVKALKDSGKSLAMVPTMGALHAGHVHLVNEAAKHADAVAASIFVNPTQFNDPADLARYPRQEEQDLVMLEAAGCEIAWLPTAGDMYPDGFATTVSVTGISKRWEGEHRLGHFDGVATVVAKLLIACEPDVALFGEKDFQQLTVIRRLVADLGLPVEIVGVPTVRDAVGLALSSRNAHLSPDERERALALPKALRDAAQQIAAGEPVGPALAAAKQALVNAGFLKIDYFALVDASTLVPLSEATVDMRLIAAATIGKTRLIDNVSVISDTVSETGSPPR